MHTLSSLELWKIEKMLRHLLLCQFNMYALEGIPDYRLLHIIFNKAMHYVVVEFNKKDRLSYVCDSGTCCALMLTLCTLLK